MDIPWEMEIIDRPNLAGWSFKRRDDPPGWYVAGPCPGCGHPVDRTWPDDVYRGDQLRSSEQRTTTPSDRVEIPIRCVCKTKHADGEVGCGRSWQVDLIL